MKENTKKIEYTKHFKKQNHKEILNKATSYKYQYHLTITYKNKQNYNQVFKHLFKNNKDMVSYNYVCYTRKDYKQKKNIHKRKLHTHSILLSNTSLNIDSIIDTKKFKNLDIGLVLVWSCVNDVLHYIHNGHHKILSFIHKRKYKNSSATKVTLTLRERMKLLRISNTNDYIIRI